MFSNEIFGPSILPTEKELLAPLVSCGYSVSETCIYFQCLKCQNLTFDFLSDLELNFNFYDKIRSNGIITETFAF